MADDTTTNLFPQPIINLLGDKVALGPQDKRLIPLMTAWDNDFVTNGISGDDLKPFTQASVAASVETRLREGREGWYGFTIYERATWRLIGHTNLRDVNTVHRTGEIGILIGERDCRGKG